MRGGGGLMGWLSTRRRPYKSIFPRRSKLPQRHCPALQDRAVFPKYGALPIVPVEAVAANPKATRQEQCHPTKTWPRSLGETTMRDPALRTPAAAPRKTGDPMQRKVFPTSARAQLPQRGLEVPNKSFRNLDCGENFGDHPVGIQPFQICFGLQENAVAQNRQG